MASAKKIRDEIMTMTIVVNSNPAQQEIYNLTKKNRELTQETQKLREERTKIAKTLGKESEEYKVLTKQINDNSSTITNNNRKIKELGDTLDISQMSVKQLKQELVLLRRELDRVVPGSEQYRALQERIGQVSTKLSEVRNGAKDTSLSFGALADRFNQYSGIIAGIAAVLVGFGISIQAVIDRNNKMADAMTAVEKTTGMAKSEVEELTKEFADFDTRTSKIDLLKIAQVGGRLGVAKSEIKDFTKEVDKAYVALGDSWEGGVEKLADSLGRIAGLYAETKDLPIADSINQIGSALNELAAQGASSEQNIADFVTRMGSLPPALKPALNTLLGFGSAFEESGVNAEIASSGFGKFLRVASTNIAGFAEVMRLPVEQVKEMINTNPSEFFLKFSQGLNGLDPTDLAKVLDYLKLSDNEVQRVIGAASENTDRFTESVRVANRAVAEGTSLTNEANKVNNNAAAVYEKLQKKIASIFTSETVANGLNTIIDYFGIFLGVNKESEKQLTGFGRTMIAFSRILAVVVSVFFGANAVIATYNLLIKESTARVLALQVIEKTGNALKYISNGLQAAYNILVNGSIYAVNNLTRSIAIKAGATQLEQAATERATLAQIQMNTAMSANPIGAVLALIGLLIAAYYSYKAVAVEATEAKKNVNEVMKEGSKNAADEVTEVNILVRTAMKAKQGTDERRKAIEELQKKYPSYFGNLDVEKAKNEDLRKSYYALKDAIVASARAEAAKDELKKRQAERLKRDQELQNEINVETGRRNDYKSKQGQSTIVSSGPITAKEASPTETISYEDLLNASRQRLQKLLKAREANKKSDDIADEFYSDAIEKEEKRAEQYRKDKEKQAQASSFNTNVGGKEDKSAEKARKEKEDADRKAQELKEQHDREMEQTANQGEASAQLARQIQLDIEDATIEAMKEGNDKEIDMINLQEQRKLAEIDKKKVGSTEINVLQKKIDTATKEDKDVYEALMKSWKENNANLENLKLREQSVFEQKRKALKAKSEVEWLKEQDDAYTKEAALLERKKNEELASYENLAQLKAGLQGRISDKELKNITTWEQGKEALTKTYQKQEIDLHIKHLQDMLALYEKGLDLSILNEDQKKKITEQIEFAKNEIAKLSAAKKDLKNGENSKEKGLGSKNKLGNQGSTDILGMSIDDWKTFRNNIKDGVDAIGTVQAAVAALQSAFSTYYSFVQAKEQAQIQEVTTAAKKKEASLKKMLDNRQINQEQYESAVQRLNQETEMKKWQLEYAAAKRQKAIQIAQTIANTAMAIMGIWAEFPKADFGIMAGIMSGVVGALGAVQVATIAQQPLPEAPGFEDGFGMEYDMLRQQDGKKFNVVRKPLKSGPVYRPTHFIAGENYKMEMVIDNQTYRGFSPTFRRALHNEIAYSQGAQGYERGSYPVLRDPNYSGGSDSVYAEALNNNTQALNEFKRTTIRAYVVKDMDSAKNTIEMIDEYNSYQNQAKKK